MRALLLKKGREIPIDTCLGYMPATVRVRSCHIPIDATRTFFNGLGVCDHVTVLYF